MDLLDYGIGMRGTKLGIFILMVGNIDKGRLESDFDLTEFLIV